MFMKICSTFLDIRCCLADGERAGGAQAAGAGGEVGEVLTDRVGPATLLEDAADPEGRGAAAAGSSAGGAALGAGVAGAVPARRAGGAGRVGKLHHAGQYQYQ